MNYATIQPVVGIEKHPNADLLEIAQVLGYKCIVKKDLFKVGDLVVFIQPDTVLPDAPWAQVYKAKSNRVKSIKLRNVWSFGIVESPVTVGYTGPLTPGMDISNIVGVTKYDPPVPQELNAKGNLPFGIGITDETRYQSIPVLPFGELVDVTLKVDGQSWSAYCAKTPTGDWVSGILGRKLEYKLDCVNDYTKNNLQYKVLEKLIPYCKKHNISLCIRGEQYGSGIQKFPINTHTKEKLSLAFFSTYLIDEHCYARKGHPLYIFNLAKELDLPTVPMLEENVVLTQELVQKYDEELTEVNGKPFEGVVINTVQDSFKIINKYYDSKK